MADSRWKIAKDGWGSRKNFQHSYGLGMTPEDLAEGDDILDTIRKADADNLKESDVDKVVERTWVKGNRERYEARGRSELKETVAQQLAEEYDFAPTGDPEMDIIIAMGLRDMKSDSEDSDMTEPRGDVMRNQGGSGEAVEATKSKRQLKRARQRERKRQKKHNERREK